MLIAGITYAQTVTNQYVVITDAEGIVISQYIESARIETKLNVKIVNSLSELSLSDAFEITGECTKNYIYKYNNKIYHCLETHMGNPDTNPNLWRKE